MSDTLRYNHNAFISYAWANNRSFVENGRGWVSTVRDHLDKFLGQELPRALSHQDRRIWIDYEQMRGNNPISDTIRARLEASHLYVPILSKSWLDSPWCLDELNIFLGLHGTESKRIFPIWMEPVKGLPKSLDDLLKYKLWYEDEANRPRTRCLPAPDPTDREYFCVLQDLARDMAERLLALAEEEAPRSIAAPARPAAPIRPEGEHLVLINGGDDDWELVQKVARRLDEDHGIGYALPLRQDSGLKSSEIRHNLRGKLNICNNVLLIYEKGPKHQVDQHITETLRSIPRRPKSAPPLDIALCHSHGAEFNFKPPGMKLFPCNAFLEDCARQLVEGLA